ncbi:MAG: ATP-binding protein [Thermoleophilia bacterium]
MLNKRIYWQNRIENAWDRSSVLWLSGVRKTGKTLLSKSISGIEYFDCELPGTRRYIDDPTRFLDKLKGKRVVLDEIHRIKDPAALLKEAAVNHPDVRIIATGPSTLASSPGFKKDLTGRMEEIWLTPVMSAGLSDFNKPNVVHRLHAGGLPPFFLKDDAPEREYQEWMDSYWAKDVQDEFRLEKRWSFQRFLELLFENSGAVFEATRYAGPCEISRPTVASYLRVMEDTFAAHVIRPFHTGRPAEITSAPKVYAFDTGFVCYFRGLGDLTCDNLANLWEHFILNEIQSRTQTRDILYWRDKHGYAVDFILTDAALPPIAIQSCWRADEADIRSLKYFRRQYPGGENWVVANDVSKSFEISEKGMTFKFMGLKDLAGVLEERNLALTA